ncbi:MAG: flagellar basal-body rod protein FlgF [Firmicutes bacterium]|nr:flagellar basal-body rod protein FlgF [Bacillota bacterium]
MVRGLYIAGTGMITQMKRMDVLSNNLANVDTNGFKEDSLLSRSFEDMLIDRIGDPAVVNVSSRVGQLNTGIHIDSVYTGFEQGSAKETNCPTDLMIKGEGFFVVLTENGERYTRDGAFEIDGFGRLATKSGDVVLGENGAINLSNNNFTVKSNGEIYTEDGFVDKIKIINFDNNALRKTGNNLYENYLQSPEQTSSSNVAQGFVESSNVDLAKSMVRMVEVYRNYESNQRIIKMIDDTLAKAVNEIGKI